MIRDFTDLLAWQLAQELRAEVLAVIEKGPVARDLGFCDQIRDSSASGPRNIAEGYGRMNPGEFAYFLRVARGSLVETRNHLIDAGLRGYLEPRLRDRLVNLASAATRVTTGLMHKKEREAEARRNERRKRGKQPPP